MPLPYAEPIGVPAPIWLLQSLLVLTFSLHLVPMSLTLGGSLIALVAEVRGRMGEGGGQYRRLAASLWRLLPTITAFTITLGVAPLLFVQVLYGKFFYPASILTGWTWFAVVPLLIFGYGMLYLQAMGDPQARWRPWAGLGAVAAFLAVAGVYVSTMSLTTAPELWKELYASSQAGLHTHFQVARGLHVLLGATAMAGALVGLLGHLTTDDERFSRFARRYGLYWLTGSLLLGGPASLWFLSTFGPEAVDAVIAPVLWLVVLLALAAFSLLLGAERRGRWPLLGWLGMGALVLGGAVLALQRHLVRQALLAPHITDADWAVSPQWDVFAIFGLLLVAALGVIGYMLVRFLRAGQAHRTGRIKSAS